MTTPWRMWPPKSLVFMDQMDGLSHAALGSGTSHQVLMGYCQYRVEAATLHTQVGPGIVPTLAGLRQEDSKLEAHFKVN